MKLPHEVVRFEIFKYLDYNDRDALNACLPFEGRVGTPLKKDANIQLLLTLQAKTMSKLLRSIENNNNVNHRSRVILKLFRSVNKINYILQHSHKFRIMYIDKCKSYLDEYHEDYDITSKHFKKTMMILCSENIKIIDTVYPYKYELSSIINKDWSAVQARYVAKETWRSK